MLDIHIDVRDSIELNVYHCGIQECESGHSYGPAVRDHYLIHYVLAGTGTFHVRSQAFSLGKGQGFLICPGEVTFYQADKDTPWTYAWVGFHGTEAKHLLDMAGLDQAHPIFRAQDHNNTAHLFRRMADACRLERSREVRLRGILYEFLSDLIESAPEPPKASRRKCSESYVQKAIEYIALNYSQDLTVSQLARHLGLDRSYLCYLFKQIVKLSPQEFIIRFRIEKSRELMRDPRLSISDIARSVGYEHPLTFSKAFRREVGMAPSHYRKTHGSH
jgi:AraC-like DNA-binding protein